MDNYQKLIKSLLSNDVFIHHKSICFYLSCLQQ
ncbi:unnamed protein product [Brugia timori]|uniref:Transcriptional regulator n=1 Tax=Brugia timori TaxID=42155 RepID=A0A0R3RBQ9_9BILA|nr:unnamed protein product [Brugia timori]